MIHVYKKWYIEADKYQYMLYKKKMIENKKTGELMEKNVDVTYHSTVSSCLTQLVSTLYKQHIFKYDAELEEAIKAFQDIENVVLKSINGDVI